MCSAFLEWLTKYEAVAIWLEGIALVLIFVGTDSMHETHVRSQLSSCLPRPSEGNA
jgi:hypothetical protein